MAKLDQPLFADKLTAAKLLCMKPVEFLRLVETGSLPGPCKFERWDVAELSAIMRGDKVRTSGDLQW